MNRSTTTPVQELERSVRKTELATSVLVSLVLVLAITTAIALMYAWGVANAARTVADAQLGTTAGTAADEPAEERLELHPEWGGWEVQLTECAHHDDGSTHAVVRYERSTTATGAEAATYHVECYGPQEAP